MILVDTSVWVPVLREGRKRSVLEAALAGADPALSRFTQLELLRASRDEGEWDLLSRYLAVQDYLELDPNGWAAAVRIQFDLRRRKQDTDDTSLPNPIDCCIAQIAIDHDVLLLHDDCHFEDIAQIRDLRQRRLEL